MLWVFVLMGGVVCIVGIFCILFNLGKLGVVVYFVCLVIGLGWLVWRGMGFVGVFGCRGGVGGWIFGGLLIIEV